MIIDLTIIIHDQFQPPSLPHVKLLLGKEVLQALVVHVDLILLTLQVVPPDIQSKHDYCQLHVMRWIVLLVSFQLA